MEINLGFNKEAINGSKTKAPGQKALCSKQQ